MEKIKQFVESEQGKDILVVLIVILVGLGSFGLGRLSKESKNSGIKIEYGDQNLTQEASVISATESSSFLPARNASQNDAGGPNTKKEQNSSGKNFFASSRGSKYYSLGCSAGKSLKQENRIYFTTKEEAERAGYELSSSCR